MTKIDIISGFLGAGKTTLIRKLLSEALKGEKVVLIENEFGEIGIDGGFLRESGIEVTEMNSGCICCSLVGDFGEALTKVVSEFQPDRILIEPSGVGKLSDVIRAVEGVAAQLPVRLNSFVTVTDAGKVKLFIRNFGEFYLNQIQSACAILLTRTADIAAERLDASVAQLREHNAKARIVTTPWDELTGAQLLAAMEESHDLAEDMLREMASEHHHVHGEDCACGHEHGHHHAHGDECACGHDQEHGHEHHHAHDEDCACGHEHGHGHHHAHGEDCACGHDHKHVHGHHHAHDEDCACGHEHGHGHHHAHGEDCACGHEHEHVHEHHHAHGDGCACGHDHGAHDHAADEVFTSWGVETPHKYTREALESILTELDSADCGMVLRAKGIVPNAQGGWLHFDYVPGEYEIREGAADYTGRLCVIGAMIDEARIRTLFDIA